MNFFWLACLWGAGKIKIMQIKTIWSNAVPNHWPDDVHWSFSILWHSSLVDYLDQMIHAKKKLGLNSLPGSCDETVSQLVAMARMKPFHLQWKIILSFPFDYRWLRWLWRRWKSTIPCNQLCKCSAYRIWKGNIWWSWSISQRLRNLAWTTEVI